jgi:hypothetical protein
MFHLMVFLTTPLCLKVCPRQPVLLSLSFLLDTPSVPVTTVHLIPSIHRPRAARLQAQEIAIRCQWEEFRVPGAALLRSCAVCIGKAVSYLALQESPLNSAGREVALKIAHSFVQFEGPEHGKRDIPREGPL